MTKTSETVRVPEPAANQNREYAGYTPDILIAMLAELNDPNFYWYCGRHCHSAGIGHRRNDLPDHGTRLVEAAAVFRRYGVRVRISRYNGRAESLTVYGPKRGGSEGLYSA